jgi:hypothetical protein
MRVMQVPLTIAIETEIGSGSTRSAARAPVEKFGAHKDRKAPLPVRFPYVWAGLRGNSGARPVWERIASRSAECGDEVTNG